MTTTTPTTVDNNEKATTLKERALGKIAGHDARAKIMSELGITKVHDGIPVIRYRFTRPSAVATVEAEIEDLLLSGREIPLDVAAPIMAAEKHDAEQLARVAAIDAVVRRHAGTDEIYNERAIRPAIDFLRIELARVIASAKEAAPSLHGAITAGEVIKHEATVVDAWRALAALRMEYDEIRDVQKDLQRKQNASTESFTDAKFDAIGLFADAIEVHPYWVQRRRSAGLVSKGIHPEVMAYREWLGSAVEARAFEDRLEPEYQLALIATTTTPWIPYPSEYDRAWSLARHATGQAGVASVEAMQMARVQYFELTGATHSYVKPTGEAAITRVISLSENPKG